MVGKEKEKGEIKAGTAGGKHSFECALSQLPFLARVPMIQ